MTINGHDLFSAGWIRFAVQVCLLLFAIAGIYFKVDNRVTNLEHRVDANTAFQQTMDANGTHKSHETDFGQQTQIDDLTRRIGNHDVILNLLVPRVEHIDTLVTQQSLGKK